MNESIEESSTEVSLELNDKKPVSDMDEFNRVVDAIQDLLFIVDRDFRIVRVNRKMCDVLKKKPEELIGRHCYEVVHGTDAPWPGCPHNKTLETGKPTSSEIVDPNMGLQLSVTVSPIFDEKGGFTQCLHFAKDITESIKKDEERARSLHDLGERVKELRCLYGISRLVEIPGITLEEIMRGTVDLLPPAYQYPTVTCARIVLESQEFVTDNFKETARNQKADLKAYGKRIGTVEVDYVKEMPMIGEGPFLYEERDLIDAVAERLGRIVERKRTEMQALESQKKFEGLFRGNPEAAVYVGQDFRIREANPRFSELFGYSIEEIRGKHVNEVVAPRDKNEEAEAMNKEVVDGISCRNTVRRRKDGSVIPVSVSAAPIIIEDQIVGYVGIYKDISDLKNAEKKLELSNEKLRVSGGLTRHDVRNKLSGIMMNAFLAKKELPADSKVVGYLDAMETVVRQTVKIFDFAKACEMLGAEELVYVDVGEKIDEAVSLFSTLKSISVENDCHGLTVLADSLLRQLFYNLIDNSLKHGKKTTKISIHCKKNDQEDLEIAYEDDGVGIPAAEKQRLFKEGYSTGGSTGYGLCLIKRMVETYGWVIQETGEPGRGVEFTIRIPKTNQDGKDNYRLAEP